MNNIEILTLNKPNINDFAEERNRLLKKAKSMWVLFVDTDETISDKLNKEIESLNPGNFNGFYIKRKIIFLGHEIGEDKVLRLGKKEAGKWRRKVHEFWDIKGKVGILDNYLIHNTAEDLTSYIDKINKYSDIHAGENLKEGKYANILKIIFYPKIKFIINMIQGRGFTFSMLQSFHSFLGWSKQWELQKR
jgi:hypothetical protein